MQFGKQLQESSGWLCRVGHIKASANWARHHQVSSIKYAVLPEATRIRRNNAK